MFGRLAAWWTERRRPRTDRELAEEEALRRQVEAELRHTETDTWKERQRIDAGGGGGAGGGLGW
jgi:hypothetical protein